MMPYRMCDECSGIVFRQTNSGKIVPVDDRCIYSPKAQSEWISVDERLPELSHQGLSSDRVLVAQGVKHKMIFIAFYRIDGWRDGRDNEALVRPELISHWMPMPEPPRVAQSYTQGSTKSRKE